ncbi:MAG: class I SAM-dependent methyltransferase [Halobacteriota archaeon]|nr:class I SAM-dependent methyltransferase [Halobacteriota archaeon]
MNVEYKDELLENIVRVTQFFVKKYHTQFPTILDIGCGLGTLSTLLLDSLDNCKIVGVDSSEEMIEESNRRLKKYIPDRYSSHISNFNFKNFWTPEIDRKYDFIVSSLALHYLSDERRSAFFSEIHEHLKENGVFIACIGNLSKISEIREMEEIFKAEYAYKNVTWQENDPDDFESFLNESKDRQREMKINWRIPEDYLTALKDADFEKYDIVWHIWVKSIFVAIK